MQGVPGLEDGQDFALDRSGLVDEPAVGEPHDENPERRQQSVPP
jgi:hypothetical protein